MNPQSDILTGINEFDTKALQNDTQQRLDNLFSSVPNIPNLPPNTVMPQAPSPDNNINLTEDDQIRARLANQFADLNKKFQFSNDDIYLKQDDTKRYIDEPYGFRIDRDNEDFYAKQQGWFKELSKGLFVKLPILTLTKLGTSVGYLLGLANPVNWFKDNYVAAASDNVIAKAFSDLEDNVKNKWLTTFQEASDRNKGFFSRMFTDENFWTEDVLDGAAFMASAFVPGVAVSKLGLGAKLGSAMGMTRAVEESSMFLDGLKAAAVRNTDAAIMNVLNTSSEAVWEAKQVKDKVYQDMINSGKHTDQEAQNAAGSAARDSFLANLGLLSFSNAWEANLFFKALKKYKPKVNLAETSLLEDYKPEVPTSRIGKLLDSKPAFYIKHALEGVWWEGFYEENLQLAVQRHNDKSAKYGGVFSQFLHQSLDALSGNDPEAADNIGVGALIGALFGTGGGIIAKEHTREQLESQHVADAINAARNNWLKAGDIYYKDNKTGDWRIDVKKLGGLAFNQFTQADNLENVDALTDPSQINIAKKQAFASFVNSHIQNGTFDKLIDQVQDLKNRKPEELVKMGFDPNNNTLDQINEYVNYANKLKTLRRSIDKITALQGPDLLRKEMLYNAGAKREAVKDEIGKIDNDLGKLSSEIGNFSATDSLVELHNTLNAKLQLYKSILNKVEDKDFADRQISNLESQIAKFGKENEDSLKKLNKDKDGFYGFENKERNEHPLTSEYVETLVKKADLSNTLDAISNQFNDINSNKDGFVDKIYKKQTDQIKEAIQKMDEEKKEQKEEKEKNKEDEDALSAINQSNEAIKEPAGPVLAQQSNKEEPEGSTPDEKSAPVDNNKVEPAPVQNKVLGYDEIKNEISKASKNLVNNNKGLDKNDFNDILGHIRKSLKEGSITEEQHDYLMQHIGSFRVINTGMDTDEDQLADPNEEAANNGGTVGEALDNTVVPEITETPDTDEPGFIPSDPSIPDAEIDHKESLIAWRSSLKTVTQEEEEDLTGRLKNDDYVKFKQKFLRTLLKNGNFENFTGILTKDKPEYPRDQRAQDHINATGEYGSVLLIADKNGNPLYFDENYNYFQDPKEGSKLLSYSFTKEYWKDMAELRAAIGQARSGINAEDIIKQYQEEEKKFGAARDLNNLGEDVPINFVGMSAGALRIGSQLRESSAVLEGLNYTIDIPVSTINQYVPTFENRNLVNGGLYAIVHNAEEPDTYVRLQPNKLIETSEVYNQVKEFINHDFVDEQTAKDTARYLSRFLYLNEINRPGLIVRENVTTENPTFNLRLVVDNNLYNEEQTFNYLQDQPINPQREFLESNIFNQAYLDGDSITYKDIDYKDFIVRNSKTKILPMPTDTGKTIRYLNTYLIFDIPKSSDELRDQLTNYNPEAKPREDSHVLPGQETENKNKTLTKEPLKKRKRLEERPGEENKDNGFKLEARKIPGAHELITGSEIAHVNRLFGKDVITRLNDVVNSDAWGTWTKSGITLYADAVTGTGYHEAWHHFSQLYLTKGEKRSLYDEVRIRNIAFTSRDGRKLNTRSASDFDIEEFVADDFRDYTLNDGKSILASSPKRNTIFRKILNFIKEFFFGRVNPEKFYQELLSEELNQYNPSIDNAFWGKLNAAIQTKDGVELFDNHKASYYRGVADALLGQILLEKNGSIDRMQTDPKFAAETYKALYNNIYRKYYTPLYDQYEKNEPHNEALLDDLEKLIQNWDDFTRYHTIHTKLGYYIDRELPEVDKDTEGEEEDEEFINLGEDSEKSDESVYSDKLFDIAGNEKASFDYAYLETKGLIRMLPRVLYRNGEFKIDIDPNGFPKLNEFSKTWNNIALELEGMMSYSAMYRKLNIKDIQIKIPEATELVKRLPAPDKLHTKDEINRITKFYQDFNKAYVGVYSGALDKTGNQNNFYFNEETKRNRDLIIRNWNNNFLSMPEDSDYIKADYVLYDEDQDRYKLNPNKPISFDLSRESGREDLMNLLGMKFSDETKEQPAYKKLIRNYLTQIQDNINQRHAAGDQFYNPLQDLRRDSKKIKGMGGILNGLARFEARFNSETPSLSYQTAEGNMIHGLMLNNYLTTITHALNSIDNYYTLRQLPEFKHLDFSTNPYVRNSVFLNGLFDFKTGDRRSDEIRLDLGNYNGLKITGDYTSAGSTTSLNTRQKGILDINALLTRGAVEIPRTEASTSAYFIKLSQYANGSYLPVKIEEFSHGFKASLFISRIMIPYLYDELYRIKNTNIMGVSDKIKTSAGKFHLFRDILNKSSEKEALKERIREGIKAKDIEKVIEENYGKIEEAIVNFFDRELFSFKEALESENIDSKDLDSSLTTKYNETQLYRAFIANDFILNNEYLKLFNGDTVYQADYKDFFKRSKGDISTGRRPLVEQFFSNYMKRTAKNTFAGFLGADNKVDYKTVKSAVIKDNERASSYQESGILEKNIKDVNPKISEQELKRILDKYRKVNIADGQGHITLDFYRHFLLSIGNWSDSQQALYEVELAKYRLDNSHLGADYTEEERKRDQDTLDRYPAYLQRKGINSISYFPPLKIQYNGPIDAHGTFAPVMDKFSVAPLIPSAIKGTKWEQINLDLIKNGIGYTKFESGTKKYKHDAVNMYHGDGSIGIDFSNYTPATHYLIYLKEQINTNPDIKEESIFGSQVRKLILANMFSNGIASEKWLDRYIRYKNLIKSTSDIQHKSLYEDLGVQRTKEGNLEVQDREKFIKKVQQQADLRDLNDNVKDYIQYDKDTKKFVFPLESSLNKAPIQDLVLGMIDNTLRRHKINGDMLIQISSSGFEKSDFSYKSATPEEISKYGTNGLRFYNLEYDKNGKPIRTKAMQVKVGLNGGFENLLNLTHTDGNKIETRERLNELIKNEDWLNKNKHMVTLVGYRIPTQGINSIEFMEVAEFLPPGVGSSIIVAPEIVTKSGSDFDIDKMSIFRPSFHKNGRIIDQKQTDPELEKKRLSNDIISLFAETLSDPEMFMQLITPNNVEKLKPLALEIAGKLKRFQNTYEGTQILRWKNNLRKFESLLSAKRLLGIFAVNNTFSQLLQQNGIDANMSYGPRKSKALKLMFFTPSEKAIAVKNGKLLTSNKYDVEGNLKQDYFSQLINGTVDAPSDDFLGYVNLGYENAGVISWALNQGVPLERVMWFVNQPVMLKYYAELKSGAALKSKAFIQAEILTSLGINNLFGTNEETGRKYVQYSNLEKEIGKILNDVTIPPNFYFSTNELKRQMNVDYEEALKDNRRYQRLAFAYFLEMQKQAQAFREFQSTLNFDTTKFQTVIDAVKSLAMEKKISDPRIGNNNLFDKDQVDKIAQNSIISPFNNKRDIYNIMSSVMPIASDAQFLTSASQMLDSIYGTGLKRKASRALSNDWIEFIVKNLAQFNDKTMRQQYYSMLQGKDSMARRLIRIKKQFPSLVEEYPLFQRLKSNLSDRKDIKNQNVQVDRIFENATDDQNRYIDEFRKLINFNDDKYSPEQRYEVKSFFKDLALMAFLQSGFSKSNISFQELVPYEETADVFRRALDLYGTKLRGKENLALRERFVKLFMNQFKTFNSNAFGKSSRGKQYWRGKPYFIDTLVNPEFDNVFPKPNEPTIIKTKPDVSVPVNPPTENVKEKQSKIEQNQAISPSTVIFQEDKSSGYAPRTMKNASADATIAIASNFGSAGEKLTKSSVERQGKLYIPIRYSGKIVASAATVNAIVNMLNEKGAKTLNIAGNGIYTLNGLATQDQVDAYVLSLISGVINNPRLKNPIESIRTGGQTGFDEAGAKAGITLGIPTTILAPKGWKFRDVNGKDISDEKAFKERFTGVVNQSTPQDTSKEKVQSRTQKFDTDIKKAEDEYFKDWLENNPRYYAPIPKSEWNKEDLDEYYNKKGTRITIDNYKDALEQDKKIGDQIGNNSDLHKGSITGLWDGWINVPTGESSYVEVEGFRKLIQNHRNDELDEDEKIGAEQLLKKYGLDKYIDSNYTEYNPNQLSLFEDEGVKTTDYPSKTNSSDREVDDTLNKKDNC